MNTNYSFNKVTIDYITYTDDKEMYKLYLVEDEPWENVDSRVKVLQDRIYTAIDVVLDGQLASDYPDSRGKNINIEVVFRGKTPPGRFREVVERLNEIVHTVGDYKLEIEKTKFSKSLLVLYSEQVN